MPRARSGAHRHVRIAHVLAPAPFGGLETVVQLLAHGQAGRGHHVAVAAVVETADHPFVRGIRERCGSCVELVPIVAGARHYRAERRAVAALARSFAPEVVHTHGYHPDILHLRAARRRGAAAVTTLHGFTGGDWKNRLYEALQVRAAARADAAVAVSRGVADRLCRSGVHPDRVHLIRNAFEPPQFLEPAAARAVLGLPSSEAGPRVGWIGRLSPEKGPDVMLRALAVARIPDLTLSFVGDGADRPALERMAAELGVAGRVTFHGIVPDAARLLRAFDALALSSRTEGTPMVLLEAMAAGVPVAATRVGGVPDVVSDAEAALAPPDDAAALAAALDSLLARNDRAARCVAAARSRLERDFALEPWLDRYERLYTSILRPAPARR